MALRFVKVKVRTRPDRQGREQFQAYWHEYKEGKRQQRAKTLGPVAGEGRIIKAQAKAMARVLERELNEQPAPADPAPAIQEDDGTAMGQPIGLALPGTAPTLKQCWQAWRKELEGNHKQVAGTLRDKQIAFDKHIFPVLGDQPVTSITHDALQLIFNMMVENAKAEGRGVTNVHKVRNYLSGLFVHLIEKRLVPGFEHNPLQYVGLPGKSDPLKPKLPSEAILDNVSKRLPTISSILFDCLRTFGARPGEVTALQLKHIDLDACTIDIVQHIRDGVLGQATKNQTTRRFMLIRLFQQAPSCSIWACRAQRFRKPCASSSRCSLPKRLARSIWLSAAGRTASSARGAGTGVLTKS